MLQIVGLVTEANDTVRGQLAALYCRIWREPPWNEDDWTIDQVLTDLRQELQLPDALGYAAIDESVVGFTWGYRVDRQQLRSISGNEMLDYLFVRSQSTFYIDELGVDSNCRLHGVGSALTTRLLADVWIRGYDQVVLRTDDQAAAAVKLYQRFGFVDQPFRDGAHSTRRYWVLKKQE